MCHNALLSMARCCFLCCAVVLLLISCKEEDENEKIDNHIIFNGSKLTIKHARLTYNEPADLRYNDPEIGVTHYYQTMRFTDGEIDPVNDFYIENGKYRLTFSVFTTMDSHGPELKGGTFTPVHPQDFFGGKAPLDQNFYTFFILRVDDNGNGVFDHDDTWYDGLAGQIVIEGAGNSFTVTIDTNDPASNSTVAGSYKGSFEVLN